MTDTTLGQPKAALGLGSLIGESFSIFFRHFIQIIIVAFVPIVLGRTFSGLLIGFDVAIGVKGMQIFKAGAVSALVSSYVVKLVAGYLATALLVQLAYDAKLHRPVRLARYFGPTLSALLPLVAIGIVASIAELIGIALLIVPGLWLSAVFFVIAPAIVIERVGFRGLARSAALTKHYRWPIVGLFILTLVFVLSLGFAMVFLTKLIVASGGIALGFVLSAVLSSIGAGLASLLVVLTYARLREIKEGVSVDQIASVFD